MAAHLLSLVFPFLLFLVSSVHGRSLQKINYTSQNIDLLYNNIVSLASNSYTGKTDYNDVLGLVALCKQYTWLEEANEDPCLPPTWSWIQCNSDPQPRIIALNLDNKILFGLLPDFSSMDALQTIDLSSNALSGPIPSFLGTFPDLQELNLAYNIFTGLIPDSIACNKNLKVSVTGNTNLYTSGSCSLSDTPTPTTTANRNSNSNEGGSFVTTPAKKKSNNLPLILGITFSVFAVFWIAFGVFAIYRHKTKTAAAIAEASKSSGPIEEMPMNARSNDMSP